MNGVTRRKQLLKILSESSKPMPGGTLADILGVSRQVIVQDIALLRANGADILAANRGYMIINKAAEASRILKVVHSDAETEAELTAIVDMGGKIKDVFIYHKAYGIVRADMNLRSRKDVADFMEKICTGKSSLLKNATSGYHYHTILADDEETLDAIQAKLSDMGMLAELLDHEPTDFSRK